MGQSSFVCDDEELAAWEGEANRWVMLLFLVSNDKDSFDPLCSVSYQVLMIFYSILLLAARQNSIFMWHAV